MSIETFINGTSITNLTSGISNSTTSVTVDSATLLTNSGSPSTIPNFRIRIADELLLVTAITGNILTVIRGVEGTTAVSHSGGTPVNYVITAGALDQWRSDSVGSGPIINLPSTTIAKKGMLYIPNDAPFIYRFNGITWDTYGPVFPATKPNLSDFTRLESSTLSTISTSGGITISVPGTFGADYNVLHYLPSTSWSTAVLGVTPSFPKVTEFYSYGLLTRDSSTQKFITFELRYRAALPGLTFDITKWDGPTANINSSYYGLIAQLPRCQHLPFKELYLKLTKVGGLGANVRFEYSIDSYHWWKIDEVSTNIFANPDQVGFFINNSNNGSPFAATFFHWDKN